MVRYQPTSNIKIKNIALGIVRKRVKMNCSICKEDFEGFGNNAQPVNDGVCCDDCNMLVIRRRLFDMIIDKGEK